jgi:hypothetical protein
VSEPEDVDALRAALYRPGATEEDRARFAAASARPEVPQAEPDRPATRSRRRRRPAIPGAVAAVAVVAAAAGATVLLTRPAPRPEYPTVASSPIALIGDPGEQAVSRADLATLFDDAKPFLGLYLSRHATSLSSSLRTDSIAVDGRGSGPTTVSLTGIATPGQATGLMTVLVTCDRSAAYSWLLTGPKRTRTGASGPDCGGRIVTATFVPKANRVPTSIRVTVPKGVRVIVEVDLSQY